LYPSRCTGEGRPDINATLILSIHTYPLLHERISTSNVPFFASSENHHFRQKNPTTELFGVKVSFVTRFLSFAAFKFECEQSEGVRFTYLPIVELEIALRARIFPSKSCAFDLRVRTTLSDH
jgi:hypothetical protein